MLWKVGARHSSWTQPLDWDVERHKETALRSWGDAAGNRLSILDVQSLVIASGID